MKSDRERIISTRDHLYDEIDKLRNIVEEQQEKIEHQHAEIERLVQAQVPSNDSFAICLIDGDGCLFDKVCQMQFSGISTAFITVYRNF
jgi:hypothetical protein